RHAERMGNAERHDAHDMNGEVAQRCSHRPTAMQPVERRQERHDHEMAGDLDTKGTTPARRMAAPGLVDDLAVGAGEHRQDEQSGPNRHQSPMPRHHRAFSQSLSPVQQSSRARPLTTMPIWPSGRTSRETLFRPRQGSVNPPQDHGGTKRSPDGIIANY